MSKLTKEDIATILEALEEAYEKAGRKLKTAYMVGDGDEEGEMLIDNRDKDELH
jgi:phosphoserine phosphatase